jgi:hypothetical protein
MQIDEVKQINNERVSSSNNRVPNMQIKNGLNVVGIFCALFAMIVPVMIIDLVLGFVALVIVFISRSKGNNGKLWIVLVILTLLGLLEAIVFNARVWFIFF